MFCDKCGTPLVSGAQYCTSCGKQVLTGVAPSAAPSGPPSRPHAATYVSRGAGDGRVSRNIQLLAGLWLANAILRFLGLAWWAPFHGLFFDRWSSGWPFHFWPFSMFGGVTLTLFGVLHLLLAWGLFQRQPWARVLGIVLACFALLRFPLGTALGIYTLWVLAPESSGREYDAMAPVRAPLSVAR